VTIEDIIRAAAAPSGESGSENLSRPAGKENPGTESSPGPLPGGTVSPPSYTQLQAIRYWTSPDYTRVVIELSAKVPFTPPTLLPADPALGLPPRLFIDFNKTIVAASLAGAQTPEPGCFTLPIGDGLLKKARAGQYQPDVARVVLDIERIDRFNAFPLPGESFRYVIDVYGAPASDGRAPARKDSRSTDAPSLGLEDHRDLESWFRSRRQGLEANKFIVVLDPGHGGKDPGALGSSGSPEKDIVLAIALAAKNNLEFMRDDVKVILTRQDDRYLTLVERTALANTLNADLFVSIHINAAKNREAQGIETYFLDNTTDRAALKLAARENFVPEAELMNASDSVNRILADLITTSKVEDSVPLAQMLQGSLVRSLRREWREAGDKGVKKAPFWVLTGATMPCALVEVGFISNREEEKYLRHAAYQQAAGHGIAAGISQYLDSYPLLTRKE
jgi:N-acetylmuramoyl-L-alanine amidase